MILASKSPQRKKILKELVSDFKIIVSDSKEIFFDNYSVYENVKRVALEKALTVKENFNIKTECIIACDTVCYLNGKILQKPENRLQAFNMLMSYNNKVQQVITGVAILINNTTYNYFECSNVTFSNVTEEQVNLWLNENRFLDKAGSFEILEAQKFFNINVQGSISNIIGLPKKSVRNILYKENLIK